MHQYNSLSEAMNALSKQGYTESFKAEQEEIRGLYSKKDYLPSELKIKRTYRFEGMTNPGDQSELFALEATDGTKGTLVMSYSAEHSQNTDLIKEIQSI